MIKLRCLGSSQCHPLAQPMCNVKGRVGASGAMMDATMVKCAIAPREKVPTNNNSK